METDESNIDFHETMDLLCTILSTSLGDTNEATTLRELPTLPQSALSRINRFCGRFSKFTVYIEEKDAGLRMNECVNYFLETVAYSNRWSYNRTWGGVIVGVRVVLTFISSFEGEHDVMKWNLLQDELQAVFSYCDILEF